MTPLEELNRRYGIVPADSSAPAGTAVTGDDSMLPYAEEDDEEKALLEKYLPKKEEVVEEVVEDKVAVEEEPGFLKKSKDRLQLGMSDWFSEVGAPVVEDGDVSFPGEGTFGMSGDPTERDSRSMPERVLGAAAQPVRAVGDVFGDAVGRVVPEPVKEFAGQVLEKASANQAVSPRYKGANPVAAMEQLEEYNPRLARAVGDIGTVGSVAAAVKMPGLPKVGKDVTKRAREAAEKLRNTDIKKRWQPEKVTEARGKIRQGKGVDTYEETPWETQMYEDIGSIEKLDPRKGYKTNYNQLDEAAEEMRHTLDKKLRYEDQIDVGDVTKEVKKGYADIESSSSLMGDAKGLAINIYKEFEKRLDDITEGSSSRTTVNPRGPSNPVFGDIDEFATTTSAPTGGSVRPDALLQLRRDMDKYITAGKEGSTVFDPQILAAQNIATKAIRDRINGIIIQRTKDADMQESLRKQSSLLTARDRIGARADTEAKSGLGRVLQRTQEKGGFALPHSGAAVEANIRPIPLAIGATMAGFSNLGRGGKALARLGGSGLEKAIEKGYEVGRGPLTLAAAEELRKKEEEY